MEKVEEVCGVLREMRIKTLKQELLEIQFILRMNTKKTFTFQLVQLLTSDKRIRKPTFGLGSLFRLKREDDHQSPHDALQTFSLCDLDFLLDFTHTFTPTRGHSLRVKIEGTGKKENCEGDLDKKKKPSLWSRLRFIFTLSRWAAPGAAGVGVKLWTF